MLGKGEIVLVYDGDLIGWTIGELEKKYNGDKWSIRTKENSSLVRHIKEDYTKLQDDGCGYVVNDSLNIKLRIKGTKLIFEFQNSN
ncbi:hypothetical protein [Clostridium ihumii]|uniref:hypothetical protein n=1 Tax=Clostridium ihumii TaxID=1470356 RepID=UPI00055208BA|nr:hypothetical protein [Clostridium ihumii]